MDIRTIDGVLAATPLPQLLIDAVERVAAVNAEAEALLGRQLRGRHYITAVRQPAVLDCIEAAMAGRAATASFLSGGPAAETSWRVTARPIRLPDQRAVLVTFEDTTAVEEALQIRRDFVANVSHELRTPLTALIGFIETLRGTARRDPAAQDRFLAIMEREAGRMNRLVHDLLSLSRVESEERRRPTQNVDLSAVLRSVTLSLKPVAGEARIALEGAEVERRVLGDADQLAQVFTNLIDNAIKYGQVGGTVAVTVSADEADPALRGPAIRVAVRDDGDGIDPVHIPRLTERFYRIDTHRSREKGGTGLGLAIVKHIVNRHRGRLRIESRPGEGSVFTVILPAA